MGECKESKMGTPNRKPQVYNINMIVRGSLFSGSVLLPFEYRMRKKPNFRSRYVASRIRRVANTRLS